MIQNWQLFTLIVFALTQQSISAQDRDKRIISNEVFGSLRNKVFKWENDHNAKKALHIAHDDLRRDILNNKIRVLYLPEGLDNPKDGDKWPVYGCSATDTRVTNYHVVKDDFDTLQDFACRGYIAELPVAAEHYQVALAGGQPRAIAEAKDALEVVLKKVPEEQKDDATFFLGQYAITRKAFDGMLGDYAEKTKADLLADLQSSLQKPEITAKIGVGIPYDFGLGSSKSIELRVLPSSKIHWLGKYRFAWVNDSWVVVLPDPKALAKDPEGFGTPLDKLYSKSFTAYLIR